MSFMQIIEFRTGRIDEFDATVDEWLRKTEGRRTAGRSTTTRDRDNDKTYLQIVEFPSYEQAMANSELPETRELAARLAELCDGPPTFRNLDVVREVFADTTP